MVYHGISIMHLFLGDTQQALKFDDIALDRFIKSIGANHTTTARVYNNKGNIYKKIGSYEESLKNFNLALDIKRRALGMDHHAVATTLNNMAEVYLLQEKYDEYLPVGEEEHRIKCITLGASHADTIATKSTIDSCKSKLEALKKRDRISVDNDDSASKRNESMYNKRQKKK